MVASDDTAAAAATSMLLWSEESAGGGVPGARPNEHSAFRIAATASRPSASYAGEPGIAGQGLGLGDEGVHTPPATIRQCQCRTPECSSWTFLHRTLELGWKIPTASLCRRRRARNESASGEEHSDAQVKQMQAAGVTLDVVMYNSLISAARTTRLSSSGRRRRRRSFDTRGRKTRKKCA